MAVTVPITVAGLAEQAEISVSKIIMSLMKLGIMATVNQTLDKDTVEMLGVRSRDAGRSNRREGRGC